MKRRTFIFALMLAPTLALADCIDDAARFHHVDARLMHAVAQVESQMHAGAVGYNQNGSVDIGLMQINSSWLPSLARYGITRAHLFDACTSAYLGSWIMSRNIQQMGFTWEAIGAYNARNPAKRLAYAQKVYRAMADLVGSTGMTPTQTPLLQHSVSQPLAVVPGGLLVRSLKDRRHIKAEPDVSIVAWEPEQ